MAIIKCGSGCTFETKNSGRRCGDPVESFAGAVLDVFEVNGYDDSDFYAVVYDAEADAVRHVCYASTRGWTYHNGASVDATAETIAAALAWYRPQWRTWRLARLADEAAEVKPGRLVRSTTTRGKNKGVTGYAGVIVEGDYGPRVKVDTGSDQRWLSLGRVEVVDPQVDPAAVERVLELTETAAPANWRSANIAAVAAMRG